MTDIPTYHRGDRNFGTGYDMLKQIEALEDEIERLRAALREREISEAEALGALTPNEARAALTQEGK